MNNLVIPFRGNMGVQTTPPFTNTYSLDFDGVDDFVDVGSLSNLQNATEFSISSWFKTPLAAVQGVWVWWDDADGWLELNCSADGSMIANVTRFNHTSATYGIAAAGTLTADTWYNATVVFDGSGATNADRLKLYVNGNLITLTFIGTIPTQTGTMLSSGLHIGERFNGQNYFNGNIDEVSIFDSAISIGDIWDGSGQPTDLSLLATPPLHWYRMGDNGAYKSPQWLIPNNENKDKVSNYSFEFDGVDDYVSMGNVLNLANDGSDAISISLWLKTTLSSLGYLVSKQTGFTDGYGVFMLSTGEIAFYLGSSTSSARIYAYTQNTFNDNDWHNVVITYDGSQDVSGLNIYVNNTSQALTVITNNTPNNVSNIANFAIGMRNGNAYPYLDYIDEVSIFNSELSASDVTEIYNGGEPTTISGAIAHWRMGEEATFSGGVWTVPDAVGSNDGTSNAMTIEDRVGEAPSSNNNALSYNMDLVDRTTDVPT